MNKNNQGVGLIEVLVTLLVISIGMVGLSALYLSGLQAAHSSYLRSLASAAALDFEERTWIQAGTTDGCPDVETSVESMQVTWGSLLPSLEVLVVPVATTDRLWEGILTLTWSETRFGDTVDQFQYQFGVYCSEESS